jgi:transcriptional regulator with XRE-family HTH domain
MRTARALTGLSMRAYARKLGLSSATLCRIEADKGCDLSTLAAIRKASGISYAILLGDAK